MSRKEALLQGGRRENRYHGMVRRLLLLMSVPEMGLMARSIGAVAEGKFASWLDSFNW